MVLQPAIIWVDAAFVDAQSHSSIKAELKRNTADDPSLSTLPREDLDLQLCNEFSTILRENGALVFTCPTTEQAMEKIREHHNNTVFFICSGRLGKTIIPDILHEYPKVEPGDQPSELKFVRQYPQVHACYIYCFKMCLHVEWAINYLSNVKMFDHQVDLLIRLTRDIADYFVNRGEIYLKEHEPNEALLCFNHAERLETRCNERDTLNTPFMERLDRLGDKETGLIQQARNMIEEQHVNQPS